MVSKSLRLYLLLILSLCPAAYGAGSASDLYQEAQWQENTTRNPEAAIKLYTDLLQRPEASRSLRANAYLHLGLCQEKLGHREEAKTAWKKIVQDYSDQNNPYAEALKQLQTVQTEEAAAVKPSTTVVQIVYETPPARWLVEFPRGLFMRTIDSKGRLIDNTAGGSLSFAHFPEPNFGVAMEIGGLGSSGPPSARRSIGFFSIQARVEKPILRPLTFLVRAGPGLYLFTFDNDRKKESRLSVGGTLETGVVIGLSRGFAFNVGYAVHSFLQATPTQEFKNTIPAIDRSNTGDITQNRGLRFLGGPTLSLSYRW